MAIRKLVNKIWVYALLLIVMSACGSKTDNSSSDESTTTESGTQREFKVPDVNCESAVNDPLTEVTDFKDVRQGPHFHQCVHIRNTVYYPGSFENGRTRISIGNGEIGGVTAYFDERIHFFKGDSIEIVGYVDQSSQNVLSDAIHHCKLIKK